MACPAIPGMGRRRFLESRSEPPQARRPEIISTRADPTRLVPRFIALCAVELEPGLSQT
jgi:hypothetical protein